MDLTDGTMEKAREGFEALLEAEENPTPQEQPEESVETQAEEPVEEETLEVAEEEEGEEVEVQEESEPETDEMSQWLSDVQDSLKDNPELLDELQLNLKVDGEEKEFSFADIKKAQMLEADYTRKTQKLAEQRKESELRAQEVKKEFDTKIQDFAALTTTLESQINQEYQGVNWDELRQYDPAEWSAKQQEFQQRLQGLNQMKHNASVQIQNHQNEMNQKQTDEAMQQLVAAVPEWADQSVLSDSFAEIRRSAIADYGMSESFLSTVYDAGFILAMKDLAELKGAKKVVQSKAKQLKSVPKFTKPGAKQSSNASVMVRQKEARNKLKRSGSVKDAARAFEQFL